MDPIISGPYHITADTARVACGARGVRLSLVSVGATTFLTDVPHGVGVEGVNRVDRTDAEGPNGETVYDIVLSLWLGGVSGTSSMGMTALHLDPHDIIGVYFHQDAV